MVASGFRAGELVSRLSGKSVGSMTHTANRALSDLVDDVVRHPVSTLHGRSAAADSLVASGRAGAEAVLSRMLGGWESEAHPRDVIEALAYVLQRLAQDDPALLIEISRRGFPPDPYLTVVTWSLWNAAMLRGVRALPIETLQARLRELAVHENEFVRWAANEGFKALNMPPN